MFGGPAIAEEFLLMHYNVKFNGRQSRNTYTQYREYDESVLEGFVDHADEAIYKEAKALFQRNVANHLPSIAHGGSCSATATREPP